MPVTQKVEGSSPLRVVSLEVGVFIIMYLPRFKEIKFGSCPVEMSVSEYEECLKSNEIKNKVKRFLNNILDKLEKI